MPLPSAFGGVALGYGEAAGVLVASLILGWLSYGWMPAPAPVERSADNPTPITTPKVLPRGDGPVVPRAPRIEPRIDLPVVSPATFKGKPELLAEFFTGQFDRRIAAWLEPAPRLPRSSSPSPDVPKDPQSVRWTGFRKAPRPGTYRMSCQVDDAVTVKLRGKVVIDSWYWGVYTTSAVRVELGDAPVPLEVSYYNVYGASKLSLEWQEPGAAQPVPVPAVSFTHDPEQATAALRGPFEPAGKPEGTDRVVRWVLEQGGKVRLGPREGGPAREVTRVTDLPKGPLALQQIDLGNLSRPPSDGCRELFRSLSLARLRLSGTPVGDDALARCMALEVQHLDLARTGITDRPFLCCIEAAWGQLQSLDLGGNCITDRTLRVLAGLDAPQWPGEISPGVQPPAPRLVLPALEDLGLGDTAVTDAGLAALRGFKRLRRVDLRGTKVTAEAVRKLRSAWTGCQVEH